MLSVVLKGMMISGGLIIAIGSQNAFILKQGLLKQHVTPIIAICFICDVVLMSLGILGLGKIINDSPILIQGLSAGGAAFLIWYGFNAFRSAWQQSSSMEVTTNNNNLTSTWSAILAALAITLINPHVYLDTVVILGGVGSTLSEIEKNWFLLGALIVSFIWFVALGYGSRLLAPLFKKPKTWMILDISIGLMMWWIAYGLIQFLMNYAN